MGREEDRGDRGDPVPTHRDDPKEGGAAYYGNCEVIVKSDFTVGTDSRSSRSRLGK